MNTKCLPCRRAGTRIKKVNEHFWECSGERNGVSIWCNTIDRLLPEPHTQSLKVWLKERMKRMRRSLLLQKPQCLMTWRDALMMAAKTAEINDSSSTGLKSITATPRAPAQIQTPPTAFPANKIISLTYLLFNKIISLTYLLFNKIISLTYLLFNKALKHVIYHRSCFIYKSLVECSSKVFLMSLVSEHSMNVYKILKWNVLLTFT